jgi:organic hydroperoxide reductase OsmC/OhrA
MSDTYKVQLRTVGEGPTALGSAGPFTIVADRPVAAGGGGLGFNGGQLFYMSVAACISNDLYREAETLGIALKNIQMTVDGDFPGRGQPSTPITVDLLVEAEAPVARLAALVDVVEGVAEIPNSFRGTTRLTIRRRLVGSDGTKEA